MTAISENDNMKTHISYGEQTSHPRRSIMKINTFDSTHAINHNKSPNSSSPSICSNSISMKISSRKYKSFNGESAIVTTGSSVDANSSRCSTTSDGVSTPERKLDNRNKLLNTNGNNLKDNCSGDYSVKVITKKMGSLGPDNNISSGNSSDMSHSIDKNEIENGPDSNKTKNNRIKLPLRKSSVATESKGLERKSIVSMFETIAAEESISRKKSEFVKRKPSSQYYHELDQLVQQKETILKEKVGECPQRKASLFSYLSENKNIKNGDSTLSKTSDKQISVKESAPRRASLAVSHSNYSTKESNRPHKPDFSPINEEKKDISVSSTNGHTTKRRESVINRIQEIPDIIEDVESKDTFSELPSSSVRLKNKDNAEPNSVTDNTDSNNEQNGTPSNTDIENTNNRRRNSKVYGKARRTSKSELQFSGQRRSVVDMFENIAAEENISKKKSEFVRKRSSAQYYKEIEEVEEKENKTRRASLMMVGSSRRDIEKEKTRRSSLMTMSNSELKHELEIESKERRSSLMNMNILDTKRKESQHKQPNFHLEKTTSSVIDRRKSEGDLRFPTHKPSNIPRGGSISSISEEGKKVGELLESEADLYSALEKDLHRITADVSTVKSDIKDFSSEVQRKASLGSFSTQRSEYMHMDYKTQKPKLQTFDEAYSSASDSEKPNHKNLTLISENSDKDGSKNFSINENSTDKDVRSLRKTIISRKNAVGSLPGPISKTYTSSGKVNKISLIKEETLSNENNFENDSFYSSSASESEQVVLSSYSDSSGKNSRKQSVANRQGVSEDENEVLFRAVQNIKQTKNNGLSEKNGKHYSSSESDSENLRKESVIYKPANKKIDKEPLSRKSTNEDKKSNLVKEPLSRKSTNEDKKSVNIKEPLSRKSTNEDKKTYSKEPLSRKSTLTNEDKKSMYTKEALSRKSTLTDENTLDSERKKTLTPNCQVDYDETEDIATRKQNLHIEGLQCYGESNKPWIDDWFSARCELGSPSVGGTRLLCLDDLRQKRSYKDEVPDDLDSDSELEMRQRYPIINQLDIYEDLRSEGMEVVADKETRDIITDTLQAFDDHELGGDIMFRRKVGSENETDSDSNSTVISGDDGKSSVVMGTKNIQYGPVKSSLFEDQQQLYAGEIRSTTFSTMFGRFNYCLYSFIESEFGHHIWKQITDGLKLSRKLTNLFERPKNNLFNDTLTDHVLREAASVVGMDFNTFLEQYGKSYFDFCCSKYGDILKSIAANLADFINNMDDIRRHIHKVEKISDHHPPSIYASVERGGSLLMYYHSEYDQRYMEYFLIGYLKAAAVSLYEMHCSFNIKQLRTEHVDFSIISINAVHALARKASFPLAQVSNDVNDLVLDPDLMDDIFPFHMILDKNLDLTQIGISLNRLLEKYIPIYGLNIKNYFKLVKPAIQFCYNSIKNNLNTAFIFCSQDGMFAESYTNGLILKGQIMYLASSGSLWFIASPKVDRLSELNGLSVSNIPLHDATREVLLISEQSHAQDTLKSQLQVLTSRLKETSKELALGKINTETILDEIFPKYVAEQLMLNQPVPAVSAEEGSILFTDIVGFTRICGECEPDQITDMLNNLYLEFDVLSEKYEVYKVETIGDAYMAVAGIHHKDAQHARVTTLMGIEMVDKAADICTPKGESIQIRVGVHSGSVVAGVVGTRMPRYCLFGNNVTLANKMESTSEAKRVHISPETYLEIKHHQEFVFWYRKRDVMPALMQKLYQGNTYFVTQRRRTYFDQMPGEKERRLKYMKTRQDKTNERRKELRDDSLSESMSSEIQNFFKYPEALQEQLQALEQINGYEIGRIYPSSLNQLPYFLSNED